MSKKLYLLRYVVIRDGGDTYQDNGGNWLAHNYGHKPLMVLACVVRQTQTLMTGFVSQA